MKVGISMGKVKVCMTIVMVLIVTNVAAEDAYGADGRYKGEVDKGGSMYGTDGSYQGRVEKD